MTVGQIGRGIQTRDDVAAEEGRAKARVARKHGSRVRGFSICGNVGRKDQKDKKDPKSRIVGSDPKVWHAASQNAPCHPLTLGLAGQRLPFPLSGGQGASLERIVEIYCD